MSGIAPANPPPQKPAAGATPAAAAGAKPAAVPPPKKRWRRWKRILLWLAVALLVFRLLLALLLPTILNWVAHSMQLDCSIDSLSLSILQGELQIQGLTLRQRIDGKLGKNVAKLDYLLVDVATSQLLKGHLRVDRVEVDGLAADVTVDANGAFDFGLPPSPPDPKKVGNPAPKPTPPAESRPAPAAADLDFKFPIEVKAIRISHVIANFRDDTVSPPVAAQVGVDVRVTDLGVPGSPVTASVRVASPQFLETLRVDAEEFLNDGNLTGRVDVRIRGFQPRVIGAELARIGIQPRCDMWQFDLGVTAAAQATRVTGPDGKTTSKYPVETQVTLRDIRVECDRDVPISLERLAAKGKWIRGNWLTGIEAALEEVRGSMEIMPDGGIAAVGFEFGGGGAAASSPAASSPAASSPAASSPAVPPLAVLPPAPIPNNPPASSGESFVAEVTSFHATNLDCHIDDSAAGSLVDWNAVVDEIKIRGFSLDPAKNKERTSIFVKLHAPGAIKLLQLEGEVAPLADNRVGDLTLHIEGVRPDRIDPYIKKAGIRSELRAGAFDAKIHAGVAFAEDGTITADAEIKGLDLADGDPLFSLKRLALEGFRYNPNIPAGSIARFTIEELDTWFEMPGSGAMRALGVRAGGAESRPGGMGVIPLVVHDLDAKNLHLGSDAKNPSDGTPGTLEAHLSIPERIERVELAASVSRATLSPLGIAGSATLDVHGVRRVALGALLKMVGIEPEARVADFHLGLDVDARRDAGGWLADLEAKNLEITDGSTRVAGIESAKVKGARLRPDSIHADLISLVKPTLVAIREPEGMMRIGSVRFASAEVEAVGATDVAAAAPEIAAAAPEPESKPTQKPAPDPTQTRRPSGEPPVSIDALRIEGGAVTWIDECIQPRLETIVGADLAIDGFALGGARAPFKIDAKVGIAESFDELRVLGEASLAPEGGSMRGTIDVRGLRGGRLRSYLPPGTKLGMADGHLSLGFLAEAGSGGEGARSAKLELRDAELKDGNASLLKFERFVVNAPRLDPAEHEYTISELGLTGLDIPVTRSERGLEMLGFIFGAPETEPAGAPDSPRREAVAAAASRPSFRERLAHAVFPTIHVEKVELGVARIAYADDTRGPDAKFTFAGRLDNPAPILLHELTDEDGAPNRLHWKGSIEPIVGEVDLQLSTNLSSFQPTLGVGVRLSGIRGDAIEKVMPTMSVRVDPAGFESGELTFHADASMQVLRNTLLDFGFSRNFGLDLTIENFALRGKPGAPPLASFDSFHVDAPFIDPTHRRVQLRRVELENPTTQLFRDPSGIHALGFILAPPPADGGAAAAAAPQSTPSLPTEPATPSGVASAPGKPQEKSFEFAAEVVSIDNLNATYRDITADPPLTVPLVGLNFALQGFSSKTFTDDRPFRFALDVAGGNVPLPPRQELGSLLFGLVGRVENVVSAFEGEAALVERPLFDDLSIAGQLSFSPKMHGWVQFGISALELLEFRGIAAKSGVNIKEGVADASAEFVFQGDQGMTLHTRETFRYLSITEGAGGPIGTFLKLPAPLDTVIYLLRNEDGALRLSFNVQVEGAGVSTSAITAEVAKVLGEQIAVAVARAPLRILRSFTDITGATGGERTEDFKTTWLRFDPSETIPPPIEWRGVRNLSEELASDSQLVVTVQHTFAKADIDQVSRLANPTPQQCLEMADRIRQQKLELGRQRGIAAAEARALVFFGRKEECDAATDRVRALDRQIGEADAALGSFLDMLRTGSERQCERRTRNAALALANERLMQVRTALEKAGIAVERIRLRPVRMEPEEGAERSFVTLLPRRQL